MGHHPVGMSLEEFTLAVGHLWLNPDAKLQSTVFGSLQQGRHTVGQFLGVGHPVAQGLRVIGATILAAKPAIIDNEEFATQFLDAVHHLLAHLLVDIHIDTFP